MRRGFFILFGITMIGLAESTARAAVIDERTNAVLSKTEVIADDVAYCRIGSVTDEVAAKTRAAYRALAAAATNKLEGMVLDLRFAQGDDYSAAAAVADLFITRERRLLDWGNGFVKSKSKTDAIAGPIAILVNSETHGAAEALAAVLREATGALIIGNATAGDATNNSTLIKLSDGTGISRVRPDIAVDVSLADERERFTNPYMVALKAGSTNTTMATNRAWVVIERISEADLVRAKKNGSNINNLDGEIVPARSTEPQVPTIRDPALARAVDLIKGLAALQTHF